MSATPKAETLSASTSTVRNLVTQLVTENFVKVLLSKNSAAAMGVIPDRHAALNQKALAQFGQMIEEMGITSLGFEPGAIFVDISRATPAKVNQFLELIQASGVVIQPHDAHCYVQRGGESTAIADYIRQNAGSDFLLCEPEQIQSTFMSLWKRTGTPRPDFFAKDSDPNDTDDTTVQRVRKYENLTADQLRELREWGAEETEDEAYVLDHTVTTGL